jgi:hypothetical protein
LKAKKSQENSRSVNKLSFYYDALGSQFRQVNQLYLMHLLGVTLFSPDDKTQGVASGDGSSCLSFPGAWITDMHHHALRKCFLRQGFTMLPRLVLNSLAEVIFPPQPPEGWDYRYAPLHPALKTVVNSWIEIP